MRRRGASRRRASGCRTRRAGHWCGRSRRPCAAACRVSASRSPAAETRRPDRARPVRRRFPGCRAALILAQFRPPPRVRNGGHARRRYGPPSAVPPARTVTRESLRVSTQMLAEVSSTYRIMGPSTREVVMTQLYPFQTAATMGAAKEPRKHRRPASSFVHVLPSGTGRTLLSGTFQAAWRNRDNPSSPTESPMRAKSGCPPNESREAGGGPCSSAVSLDVTSGSRSLGQCGGSQSWCSLV